ncbi:unnamed protein product [Phytophthora lilii]|uniref:Unnamed protein product n=1 Tax=Phytophthora lilii TaxID=2077276 RepID=A0A9W6U4A0_9STRA|nr:unnamed protein product [Phytophthora lilii]
MPSEHAVSGAIIDSSSDSSQDGSADDQISHQSSFSKTNVRHMVRRGSSLGPQGHASRKSKYELDPEVHETKKAKKEVLLYPGQAFGEMSLLMNY